MTNAQAKLIASTINDGVEGMSARIRQVRAGWAVVEHDSDGSRRQFQTFEPVAGFLGLTTQVA